MSVNVYKFVIALSSIAAGVVLLVAGSVSEGVGVGLITTPVGYLLGNSVSAARGEPVPPAIARKDPEVA